MKNTLAIFIDDTENTSIDIIEQIKNLIGSDYDDFCIICDNNNIFDAKYPVILSIYLKFFKGSIVFMDPKSYTRRLDQLIAKQIFLYSELNSIIDSGLNRKNLKDVKFITQSAGSLNIEDVHYAKI